MGRTKIEIDREVLLHKIHGIESVNKFTTRQQLAEAVANTDWARNYNPKPITASVVLLRIKDFKLDDYIKTPKGKRGRAKGYVLSPEQKTAMQAGRGKANFVCGNIGELRKDFPESRQGLLDKVENGSLKAAIKAQCLSCCCQVTDEIRNCTVMKCPLYSFRPYK